MHNHMCWDCCIKATGADTDDTSIENKPFGEINPFFIMFMNNSGWPKSHIDLANIMQLNFGPPRQQ